MIDKKTIVFIVTYLLSIQVIHSQDRFGLPELGIPFELALMKSDITGEYYSLGMGTQFRKHLLYGGIKGRLGAEPYNGSFISYSEEDPPSMFGYYIGYKFFLIKAGRFKPYLGGEMSRLNAPYLTNVSKNSTPYFRPLNNAIIETYYMVGVRGQVTNDIHGFVEFGNGGYSFTRDFNRPPGGNSFFFRIGVGYNLSLYE